jgi:hypothetical protein
MIRYRYGISLWDIDMGDRTSMTNRYEYRYGVWDIDLGYSVRMWLSTISIGSSWISIWDMD